MADGLKSFDWYDLERIVAAAVEEQYSQYNGPEEKRRFFKLLRTADEALQGLNDGKNVDYNLPLIGEAYALKYHLMRTDNIRCAIEAVHRFRKFPKNFRVLDIGAGTGCGAMAFGYWAYQTFKLAGTDITVYGVEPSVPMRRMSFFILRGFHNTLMEAVGVKPGSNQYPFDCHFCRAITIEEAAWLRSSEQFDFVLFSFTFSVETPENWRRLQANVRKISSHVSQDGVVCFLTPNLTQKKKLLDETAALLAKDGFTRKTIPIGRGERAAPDRRPQPIIDLRRRINDDCRELKSRSVYGENPKMDDPYYGFYAQCDLFSR